jgi:hypothetical protein
MSGLARLAGIVAAIGLWADGLVQAAAAQNSRADLEQELIGAPAYSIDGTQIGEVDALEFDADDEIEEMRVTRAQSLGLGGQTVTIPRGGFITLRGAVVIELTTPEIFKLPAEPR